FFTALREFIQKNSFRSASWHDIQRSFEKATGEKLHAYFEQWLSRKDIPIISVKNAELRIEQGQIKLNFTLLQQDEAYQLRIPVTLYFDKGKSLRFLELMHSKKNISLKLDELPNQVVIDENYTLMRQLAPEEIPPVLATVMGKEKLIVIVAADRRAIYKPLIDALGVENITYLTPDKITFAQMKENSFLIAGHEYALVDMLFGKQHIPKDGVRLKVYKNPYNAEELIALLHVKNKAEAKAVHQKIPHYGKYTELAFKDGSNNLKAIAKTNNGILVLSRPPTRALKPDKLSTLDEIIPKLLTSRIIYLGEKHDQFAHHINQLQVIKKMHEAGYELAVGMEMFQRPFQKVVNDFLSGRIDEHKFLLKSEYFKRWRYDYNLYKPIIDYLKQQNIPLVA
ncbi:MAG: ChaN family lipoprotein, partial [Desulfobulbaceae bacterium]|nr:ChaN family lipoprotein [Desulfobulbaceae bacterium]